MTNKTSVALRVCVDVGCYEHQVLIGLSSGEILSEFKVEHTPTGFDHFFKEITHHTNDNNYPVTVAMEAYNGHARPLDSLVMNRGFALLNVNNHKLAHFKKIFPGPAKTDEIDARKIFEMFTMADHLPMTKGALTPVHETSDANQKLKRLTRRRDAVVKEKVVISCRMQSDLQATLPGILDITGGVDNLWFLRFLTSRKEPQKLIKLQKSSLLKIRGVGNKYASEISEWQKTAVFSGQIEWVGEMINRDANRLLELKEEIQNLEALIDEVAQDSPIAKRVATISGFGDICSATLAGEIGCIQRFKSESSLALYLGMAVLDNSSGVYTSTKRSRHVNIHAKRVMMIGVDHHIRECRESKVYYEKKRKEGKKHNQAVRALGRHMVRVIFSMLTKERDYEMRTPTE